MDQATLRARLQQAVSEAQAAHDRLAERERVCRTMHYTTSADILAGKVKKALGRLRQARAQLDEYDDQQSRSIP